MGRQRIGGLGIDEPKKFFGKEAPHQAVVSWYNPRPVADLHRDWPSPVFYFARNFDRVHVQEQLIGLNEVFI